MAKRKSARAKLLNKARTKPRPAAKKAAPARKGAQKGKWVYAFGGGRAEGKSSMRNLLGGKGAGLAEMANLGLPVPPGFTITHRGLHVLLRARQAIPKDLKAQVEKALAQVGKSPARLSATKEPAVGVGALGRARLDARHDGHRAQSRPQR